MTGDAEKDNSGISLDRLEGLMRKDMEIALSNPPPRDSWKDQQGFNTVSLRDWLALCFRAWVPYVLAYEVATVPIDDLMAYDTAPENPALVKFFDAVEKVQEPFVMLRWDCCAPLGLKARMADGEYEWAPEILKELVIGDPRAADIIYEYPGNTMTAWKRPWVKAHILDNYPVEYRVFVQDDSIVGVSNYYPQRALPNTLEYRELAHIAILMTERLVKSMPTPLRYPGWGYKWWDATRKNFTADFIQGEDGSLLFLEGGPPFGRGFAHPCCFPAGSDWADATPLRDGDVPVILENRSEAL